MPVAPVALDPETQPSCFAEPELRQHVENLTIAERPSEPAEPATKRRKLLTQSSDLSELVGRIHQLLKSGDGHLDLEHSFLSVALALATSNCRLTLLDAHIQSSARMAKRTNVLSSIFFRGLAALPTYRCRRSARLSGKEEEYHVRLVTAGPKDPRDPK